MKPSFATFPYVHCWPWGHGRIPRLPQGWIDIVGAASEPLADAGGTVDSPVAENDDAEAVDPRTASVIEGGGSEAVSSGRKSVDKVTGRSPGVSEETSATLAKTIDWTH